MKFYKRTYKDGSWLVEIHFLFTQDFWLEIERDEAWLGITAREIYAVAPKHQSMLGKTDSRTVFELGFRLPFFN